MSPRRSAPIALVAALILLVAACSTSDESGTTVVSGDPAADDAPIEQTAPAADRAVDDRAGVDEHGTDDVHADDEAETHVDDDAGDGHQDDGQHLAEAGADEHEGDISGARTVEVVMNEFSFDPGTTEVVAGETVRFVFTNEGAIEHEAMLGDAHMQEEFQGAHDDHGGGHHGDVHAVTVPAGGTGELVVTFDDPGTQYFGCHLPGHYEAGMEATLTVS